jgi:hypothetical protein
MISRSIGKHLDRCHERVIIAGDDLDLWIGSSEVSISFVYLFLTAC